MSFKTKKMNKNFLTEFKSNDNTISKEKEELKQLVDNIDNNSLPFALIKIAIKNNFLPLTIETYYEKISPDIKTLRKKDGSKYSQNSINTIKSALVTNKLFEKKDNKLYGLNLIEALKFIKNMNRNKIIKKTKEKLNENEIENDFLGKKKSLTRNLYLNKYEKYQHGFQILNDLLEYYPNKNEEGTKLKVNFNKYKSSTELIEKNMNIDKICGMLITFKYFKPFLKKFLYTKNGIDNLNKKKELNQQISGLNDGLDLVQFCIKKIVNLKNFEKNE